MAVVTVILPVVAPVGTTAVIRPSFATLKLADVPLNRTLLAPVKWLPLMVTDVPTAPLDGEKLLIVGTVPPVTVKFGPLVAVPDAVVTVILPVVAPAGTVDITWVFETKLNVADVPLNFTPLTPVKLVPLMVTAVPGAPLDGEKLLIVGMAGTTKSVRLTPIPPRRRDADLARRRADRRGGRQMLVIGHVERGGDVVERDG